MTTKKQADFGGLIQRKEDAQRPQEVPQRGAGKEKPEPPPPDDEPTKAMTLKLKLTDYKRLKRANLDNGRTHQDMMEEAVRAWLKAKGY